MATSTRNLAILTGRLGQDAELTENGNKSKLSFSVATTDSWKDRTTGEAKTKTTWHKCVLWLTVKNNTSSILKKGNEIQVFGSIVNDAYEKDGKKEFWNGINVERITLLQSVDRTVSGTEQEESMSIETE